jgi:CubicO group peptidase (beta-lactamase class C family)
MKMNRKLLIALIIAASIISAGVSSLIIINYVINQQNNLEVKIQNLMTKFQIPSLAAGIIINEDLVWKGGFGEQPEIDTVYMIGSITKTITATAILQLCESNLLNLDEDINHYLPFSVRSPFYSSIPITPRMLLTHMAGLPKDLIWSLEYYFDNQTLQWINENLDLGEDIYELDPRPSLGQFLNESLDPNGTYYDSYNWFARPGSQFHYSNAGFQLLCYLIEEISNHTYMEYLQEHIFAPLNMTSSGYEYAAFGDRNAIPYEWYHDMNYPYPFYNLNVTGAGNLRSTIEDMAKYLAVFINQGMYNGIQILSTQSVNLMLSNQVPLSGISVEGFIIEGYGLGWYNFAENVRGHGGAIPGFFANMYFKKTNDQSFGVILMFNRGSALVEDSVLINEFIPGINAIILDQAESMAI